MPNPINGIRARFMGSNRKSIMLGEGLLGSSVPLYPCRQLLTCLTGHDSNVIKGFGANPTALGQRPKPTDGPTNCTFWSQPHKNFPDV